MSSIWKSNSWKFHISLSLCSVVSNPITWKAKLEILKRSNKVFSYLPVQSWEAMEVLNFTYVRENLHHTAPCKTSFLVFIHMVNYDISSRQWELAKHVTISLNIYHDKEEEKQWNQQLLKNTSSHVNKLSTHWPSYNLVGKFTHIQREKHKNQDSGNRTFFSSVASFISWFLTNINPTCEYSHSILYGKNRYMNSRSSKYRHKYPACDWTLSSRNKESIVFSVKMC